MFIPKSFEITDVGILHDLIRTDSFGILVGTHDNAPYASHIPFVLDPDKGPNGTLTAHVARNNPQAGMFDEQQELLAIFQGPHGYVSPRWYNPGNAVPTWNYAVVHANGQPRAVTDPIEVRRQQELLVHAYEGAEGWSMNGQPDDYIEGMLRGIIAFEMPITRIEGKFKLSQNRSVADRESVIAALDASGSPWDHALADIMRKYAF
jgi:transcriptional regulator